MATLYELSGVTKTYHRRTALDVPHLRIEEGACCCVCGENGSGKTTLLEILAGLLTPTTGTVLYRGQGLPRAPKAAEMLSRDATLLSQAPYLFRGTVARNIEYGLQCRRMARAQRRDAVEAALRETNLAALADRDVPELSAGERQRVAIARALVLDTPVLLLDEPLTNVDPQHTDDFSRILQRLKDAEKTVIFSALDGEPLTALADVSIALSSGRPAECRDTAPPVRGGTCSSTGFRQDRQRHSPSEATKTVKER